MFRISWVVIQALLVLGTLVGLILALSVLFDGYIDGYARAGDIRIFSETAHIDNDRMNGRRIAVYMDIENAGGDDRLYSVRSEISPKGDAECYRKDAWRYA